MLRRLALVWALLIWSAGAAAADLRECLPTEEQSAPLKLVGEVTAYTPDNLWERLNGEAEQYRRYGLVEALAASYAHPENPDRRVELALFTMSSPLTAFGVFSANRFPLYNHEDLGNGGVVEDPRAFFWHGNIFVIVEGFGPEETRIEDARRLARSVAACLGPAPPKPALLAAFEAVVNPLSVEYFPEHLLEREALPPGLQGKARPTIEVFMATVPVDVSAVQRAYESVLTDLRLIPWKDLVGSAGVDPEMGPVTVVMRWDRLAGARVMPDSPEIETILRRLLEIVPPQP